MLLPDLLDWSSLGVRDMKRFIVRCPVCGIEMDDDIIEDLSGSIPAFVCWECDIIMEA